MSARILVSDESDPDGHFDGSDFINDTINANRSSPSKNANSITRKMMIPFEYVDIVDNAGSKIHDIATETGTTIESPLSAHEDPIFTIKGTTQGIDKAYEIIWHIVSSTFVNGKVNAINKHLAEGRNFDSSGLDDDDFLVKTKPVQPSVIGWLIGKKGQRVQKVANETDTEIRTPLDGPNPEFLFAGRKRGVLKAIEDFDSSIESYPAPSMDEGTCEVIIEVPQWAMGPVIGKKGSTVNKIMQQTGAKIDTVKGLPQFRICGSEAAIQEAEKEIRRVEGLNYHAVAKATSSSNLPRDCTEKTPPPIAGTAEPEKSPSPSRAIQEAKKEIRRIDVSNHHAVAKPTSSSNPPRDCTEKTPPPIVVTVEPEKRPSPSRAEDAPQTPTSKKLPNQEENVTSTEKKVVKQEERIVPSSEGNTSRPVAEKQNANSTEPDEPCTADLQLLIFVPSEAAPLLQPLLGTIADKTKANVKVVTRHNRQAIQIEGGTNEVKAAWKKVEQLVDVLVNPSNF